MKKLVLLRRASQIFFLVLFVYILWSTTYPLTGGISPEVLFKLDPLIMIFTAVSERVFIPGLIFAFIMIGFTFLLGRFFCGWMCPLGTIIDGCGFFGGKKRRALSYQTNQRIKIVKYFFLAVFTLLALAGIQATWVMDPIVTAARVVSFNVIPSVTFAVDRGLIWLIQQFDLYGGFYDFYRDLKANFLGVRIAFFSNALVTFLYFLGIGVLSFFIARLWCRMLCPLGALYSIVSSFSRMERKVEACNGCGLCSQRCRMGAINKENDYDKGECILCMDCVYDCPTRKTRFAFEGAKAPVPLLPRAEEKGLTRRSFLWLMASSFAALGAKWNPSVRTGVIRPPGVSGETKFLNTCVRCGNCMKVCITNGLQPVMLESGWQGLWTPQLVPEIGYCEYNCTLCGQVCPTGAIPRLSKDAKRQARLGLARVDRSICLAWALNKQCIVCEEHCPVADKAIKLDIARIDGREVYRPVVDPALCIGCGICQNKCPVSPLRAIRVESAVRTREWIGS